MTSKGKIATGFLVGAAIGTTLGILFAPKKGAKTRAMIADKAKSVGDTVNKNYEKAKDGVSKNYEKAKDMLGMRNTNREVLVN